MPFEYDPNKSASNLDKHGIDFEDAQGRAVKTFESSEEMERVFDAGEESILDYADMSTLRKPGNEQRQTTLSLPEWLVNVLDAEASRIGISRQAVIKTWLVERADQERAARTRL